MNIKLFFSIVGAITIFIGNIVYIREILRGTAKPHPFTWLGWSILTGFVAVAQYTSGAGIAFIVLGVEAFMTFSIFILSLKYGEKKLYPTDYIAFGLGLVAAALWYITKTPLWSVLFVTVADVFMFIPTIRKTFDKPFDEELFAYYTSSLAYFLSFFGLAKISLITFFYPGTLIILDGLFIILTLAIRKSFKDRQGIDVMDANVEGLYAVSLKSAKAKEGIIYIYEKYNLNIIVGKAKGEEIREVFNKSGTEIMQITNVQDLSFDELNLRKSFEQKCNLKYIPKEIFDIKNEILIFDDTIAIYDIEAKKKLTVIKNQALADNQKQLFINLWEHN